MHSIERTSMCALSKWSEASIGLFVVPHQASETYQARRAGRSFVETRRANWSNALRTPTFFALNCTRLMFANTKRRCRSKGKQQIRPILSSDDRSVQTMNFTGKENDYNVLDWTWNLCFPVVDCQVRFGTGTKESQRGWPTLTEERKPTGYSALQFSHSH